MPKNHNACSSNENRNTLLTNDQISRYSRQILVDGVGVSGQSRLISSRVLVVGAGGLGAPVLLYLAAAGIGTLGIVDFDVVDESNLQRQVIHSEETKNMSKVASAALSIKKLNSNVLVQEFDCLISSENALEILGTFDVVVDATDNVATRYLLNDACVLLSKPLVSASALRFEGQLTVYNYKDGPCYRCLFPVPPPAFAVTNCNDGGVIGCVTGVLGSLQGLEVIKILIGQDRTFSYVLTLATANYWKSMALFDGTTGNFRIAKLRKRRQDCEVCGVSPSLVSLIDYVQFCGTGANDKARSLSVLSPQDRITVKEYHSLRDTVPHLLLDCREKIQFDIVSLRNSFHNLDTVKAEIRRISRENSVDEGDVPVYVVCRRGNQSQLAVNVLKQHITSSIKDIVGGLVAWHHEIDSSIPLY